MKKHVLLVTAIAITFIAFAAYPVFATDGGTIRIEPYSEGYPSPIMLSSPATFNISVVGSGDPTCDPHIFLVMTNSCYNGLTGDVTVEWTGDAIPDLTITTWNDETGDNPTKKVPPGATEGASYTVSSLQSHLATTESIWWAFESFLGGAQLTSNKQEFTVTLPSTDPRMLVYALGKSGKDGCPGPTAPFDNKVPPTQPGLVVPEIATVALAAASFGAFALYTVRRRKVFPRQ